VLQASEVRDEVPADAHDRRVTAVVTEDGVIRFRRSMSA
jgi:5-formyltetrahydrofolate cyclo-ligase